MRQVVNGQDEAVHTRYSRTLTSSLSMLQETAGMLCYMTGLH